MKQWLSQQSAVFYVMIAAALVDLILTAVANRAYKRLIKDSDDVENSANRLVKYIKLKYTSYYKIGLKPNDEKALVRSYLAKYKVGPVALDSLGKSSIIAKYLIGALAAGYLFISLSRGKSIGDLYTFIGSTTIMLLMLSVQYKIYDFDNKQEIFCWNMYNYLSNFLKNKIENGKVDLAVTENVSADALSSNYHEKQNKKIISQAAVTEAPRSFKMHEQTNAFDRLTLDDEIDAKIVEDILKEFLN